MQRKRPPSKGGQETSLVPKSPYAAAPVLLSTCNLLRSSSPPAIFVKKDENKRSVHLKITPAQSVAFTFVATLWRNFLLPIFFVSRDTHAAPASLHFNRQLHPGSPGDPTSAEPQQPAMHVALLVSTSSAAWSGLGGCVNPGLSSAFAHGGSQPA